MRPEADILQIDRAHEYYQSTNLERHPSSLLLKRHEDFFSLYQKIRRLHNFGVRDIARYTGVIRSNEFMGKYIDHIQI